jgi:mycofactocin precursor
MTPFGRTGSGLDPQLPNMTGMQTIRAQSTPVAEETEESNDENLVEEDLLVEEISIDGMCGVY